MEIVIEETRRAVGGVNSIILAGGFGRGEGTVRKLPDGSYVPMNDYDLYVVTNIKVPYEVFKTLERQLARKIGVDIDMKIIRTCRLKYLIPDMFTFELKETSRVIWGKDLRAQIQVEKSDVPLCAGLNTLFIETLALIMNFDPRYLTGEPVPSKKAPMFDYVCSKVFVEICNALSLLGDFYDPSLLKRANLFSRRYEAVFPELSKMLPDLPSKVKYHTDLKLTNPNFGAGDLMERWLDARVALEHTLRYFVSKVLHKPPDAQKELSRFLIANRRKLASFYFEHYIRYAFNRMRLPTKSILEKFADPAVRIYENLRYSRNCYHSHGRLFLAPLLRFESPLMNVYVCAASLLFSIEENSRVNTALLDDACRLMRLICPCEAAEWSGLESSRWTSLRDACLTSFKTYASTPETVSF